MAAELKYEIVENFGTISSDDSAWKKELNLISWNEYEPKYDLRVWNDDHTKMGKGITLSKDELVSLRDLLNKISL
ncbi:MAG: PC4/YdbC family ssDNA-binding protein [Eubacteriales bacterium]|nr:PC4/YdbC family ssDNA-binding protein [Eubacteriales bacterium]